MEKSYVHVSFAQCFDLLCRIHEVKFNVHTGILVHEYSQRLHEDFVQDRLPCDSQAPDCPLAGPRCKTHKVIDLAQNLLGLYHDALSGFRQLDLPLRPIEKPDAEFFLELAYLLAERRLGDAPPEERHAKNSTLQLQP